MITGDYAIALEISTAINLLIPPGLHFREVANAKDVHTFHEDSRIKYRQKVFHWILHELDNFDWQLCIPGTGAVTKDNIDMTPFWAEFEATIHDKYNVDLLQIFDYPPKFDPKGGIKHDQKGACDHSMSLPKWGSTARTARRKEAFTNSARPKAIAPSEVVEDSNNLTICNGGIAQSGHAYRKEHGLLDLLPIGSEKHIAGPSKDKVSEEQASSHPLFEVNNKQIKLVRRILAENLPGQGENGEVRWESIIKVCHHYILF